MESIEDMVVAILDKRGDTLMSIGSGTIIATDYNKYYLLTATHVRKSAKGALQIALKVENDKANSIPLSELTFLLNSKWLDHSEADISLIEITPRNQSQINRFSTSSFPISQIPDEAKSISKEVDIMSFGYPIIESLNRHFSPLIFRSKFSSGYITLKRSDTKTLCTFQLLENPSVQGYSGGPIFVDIWGGSAFLAMESGTRLVGIMHGTYFDNTGGKLAMVTPSYYIRQLIIEYQSN